MLPSIPIMTQTEIERKPSALELVLSRMKIVRSDSMSAKLKKELSQKNSNQKEETKPTKQRKKKTSSKSKVKQEEISPDYKILTRKEVLEKQNQEWDKSYIPVQIWYYFKWKCPKCKKNNVQEYSNIYHVYGPAWAPIGVDCEKCGTHYNIIEDQGEEE